MKNLLIIIRRIAYLTLGSIDKLLHRRPRLFILCYHSINKDNWKFSIDLKGMQTQLEYLISKYQPTTASALQSHLAGEKSIQKNSFIITFDDGYEDIYSSKKMFKNMGIKPCVFLIGNYMHPEQSKLGASRKMLSKYQIKKLMADGWEIGCHSANHPKLSQLSTQQMKQEIVDVKKTMEKDLGRPIEYFAYPHGDYNQKVLQIVKSAGYKMGFTVDSGNATSPVSPLLIPREGVDRTHSFNEFTCLFLPSVAGLKHILQKYLKFLYA